MTAPGSVRRTQLGLTVVEVLVSAAIGAVLILSLIGTVGEGLQVRDQNQARDELLHEARFALERMRDAVAGTRRLMLPLADNPGTTWREHVREETVPASAPEPGSSAASAVLAVTLPAAQDVDGDGWADANNDRDFLDLNQNAARDPGEPARIDEDLAADNTNDGAPGIVDIDDDGDGQIDFSADIKPSDDNDEDDQKTEDHINGTDDDADGAVDEDIHPDMNKDAEPGVAGVDDDLDGEVDEGTKSDDDEDGQVAEDWFDPVVYYLNGDDLIERRPMPFDVDGNSVVNGLDFIEAVIAEDVVLFRVERIPAPAGGAVTVDITLALADGEGNEISLRAISRVGGAL